MSTTKWAMDATHSEIQFKVKHLLVSNVTGHFKNFNATVETQGDDLTTAKTHVTIEVNSISTNNEQRDGHLKTADFFDAANNPEIILDGDRLEKTGENEYKLYGTLTMRGITKPIVLNVEHGGVIKDPWGNTRTGFTVSGKINRKDWGVSFSMVSETGGIMLGEDVTLHASAEFIKQGELQPA